MSNTAVHTVWSQWSDLKVPSNMRAFSPESLPLDNSDLSEITIYVQPYMTRSELLEPVKRMTNLKYLQVPNAGYESAIPFLRPGITLCNARGVHNGPTAELAVGLAIASIRGFPDFVRMQDQGQWGEEKMGSLGGSKIGIIGAGSIGQTLVSYLQPYEVEISTFSRSGSNGSLTMDKLDGLLPTFDFLFLILPLNDQSRNLIDARRLALLKDGATLINVARGAIVDSEALIVQLNSGRIRAALDVTDPEPLPANHPLWRAKNVFITPHIGGDSKAFLIRGKKFIEDQLELISQGLDPLNIVAIGA